MRQPTHLSALALAAFLALPLAAAEKKTEAPAAPPAAGALRVQIDPATGQYVSPKPGEAKAALAPAPAETAAPLRVVQGKTRAGGKRILLDSRYWMLVTASVGADGKVRHTCAEDEGAPAGAAPAERR